MSSSESVDFASFPIAADDQQDLRAEFAEFCFSKAVESASDPNSALANSCEWEDFIDQHDEEDCSNISDYSLWIKEIGSALKTATSTRYRWCSETNCRQPFLQVRTGTDGVSYDMYLWILKCCLEFPPFALDSITSHTQINDSREGLSVHSAEYTLADF